ncbi:hypothetical protein PV327_010064 [Microctonus hyperodae]|uniref:Uncharacterized protein n=1 Tax=Microctonus hyperodae TaxID=165561 RepID=A0AA39F294_MICHY|nr:hypothetical protein PV327_010064 [Microctonus hyperodae]
MLGTKMIFVLLLVKSVIDAKSLDILPKKNISIMHETISKLLKSCFTDRLKTAFITPDLSGIFYETSWDSKLTSIVLVDNNLKNNFVKPQYLPEFGTFVLTTDSAQSLETILLLIKSTPWWSINGLFLIIGNSTEVCEYARNILKQTWKMNLLLSLFLCNHRDEGSTLYTYNPYTNRAPHPWKEMENFNVLADHWTLYKQHYFENNEYCDSLTFDKMKFMDGYKIKAVANAIPGKRLKSNKKYDISSLKDKLPTSEDSKFFETLFVATNITPIIYYDASGYWDNGVAVGFLEKIINGFYDIALSSRNIVYNVSSTYPLVQMHLRILTQQRDFLLPEQRVMKIHSMEIYYLTIIVLLITYALMVKIYKKQKLTSAALDVLRLLLGAGIILPFTRLSTRIYFISIFLLIIIINGAFQAHLSALLTKRDRYYVDDMNDLKTYDYKIYAGKLYKSDIELQSAHIPDIKYVQGGDCTKYVLNDSSSACIERPQRMLRYAISHKLHISQSEFGVAYVVNWCREHWPLTKKINIYLSRMIESGLYEYWRSQELTMPLKKLKISERDETYVTPDHSIELRDLLFAFELLGVGLICSIIIFVIETHCYKIVRLIIEK